MIGGGPLARERCLLLILLMQKIVAHKSDEQVLMASLRGGKLLPRRSRVITVLIFNLKWLQELVPSRLLEKAAVIRLYVDIAGDWESQLLPAGI